MQIWQEKNKLRAKHFKENNKIKYSGVKKNIRPRIKRINDGKLDKLGQTHIKMCYSEQ